MIIRYNCLRKGVYMAPTAIMINNMLNTLDEEDYNTAISFIQYSSDSRKKQKAEQSKKIFSEIQSIFSNDKCSHFGACIRWTKRKVIGNSFLFRV